MSPNPMSTWKIICEGLKLPTKNWGLMLPITLLSLLTSSIIYLANYYSRSPLLSDLMANAYAISSAAPGDLEPLLATIRKDLAELAIFEAIFIPFSFIISSFLLITTVNAIALIYLKEHTTLRELFTRVTRSWKGLLITQLLVGFLVFCVLLVFMLIVLSAMMMISNRTVALIVICVSLVLVATFLFRGRMAVWSLAIMVSMLENDCYGMKALARATEIIGERKRQAMVVTGIMASVGILGASIFSSSSPSNYSTEMVNLLVKGLFVVNIVALWNVFALSTYTVFYYDCKRSQEEEIIPSTKEALLHTSVSKGEGDVP